VGYFVGISKEEVQNEEDQKNGQVILSTFEKDSQCRSRNCPEV
jgi:hypothetical protein